MEYILLTHKKPQINQRVHAVVESVSGQPHAEFLYLRQHGNDLFWDENPATQKDFGSVYSFNEVSYWKEIGHLPHRPVVGF